MSTFTVGVDENDEPFIICDTCGSKSYNREDIRQKYCSQCNKFHEDSLHGMYLLPCAPDVCQECAVDHPPELPHNQQSLYYQYHFYAVNGRWPTWEDAMAHCTPEMKQAWTDELRKRGVKI